MLIHWFWHVTVLERYNRYKYGRVTPSSLSAASHWSVCTSFFKASKLIAVVTVKTHYCHFSCCYALNDLYTYMWIH